MINWFKKFFTWFKSDKAQKLAQRIDSYIHIALPVVEKIAALTPTRTDDEIIALFEKYGLPYADKFLALPPADRGAALLAVATSEVTKLLPTVPLAEIQTAIQAAVVLSKNQ